MVLCWGEEEMVSLNYDYVGVVFAVQDSMLLCVEFIFYC